MGCSGSSLNFGQIQRGVVKRFSAVFCHDKDVFHVRGPQAATKIEAVNTDDHTWLSSETLFGAMHAGTRISHGALQGHEPHRVSYHQQLFWWVQTLRCGDITEEADLSSIGPGFESGADRFKNVLHGTVLFTIGVRCRADMGGSIDIDPEVFVTALGFENRYFPPPRKGG